MPVQFTFENAGNMKPGGKFLTHACTNNPQTLGLRLTKALKSKIATTYFKTKNDAFTLLPAPLIKRNCSKATTGKA